MTTTKTSKATGNPLNDASDLVEFAFIDDWLRPVFKTKKNEILVVSVDGELYSRTPDWGEPCSPLGYATPSLPDNINPKAVIV